jgi:RND superfamily putative drug exporter
VIVDRQDGPIQESDIAAAQEALGEVPDIGTITEPFGQSEDGQAAAFNVAFPDDPYGNAALDRTDEMREALASLGPEVRGYVGGLSAVMADYRDGAQRDAQLIVPLVLLVIFLTLIALLRAIVAPLYLIGSVILSFFGIFGVCLVFFTQVLDETGFDPSLPIFSFIFLVALGVDYNIFLMDRVREEARHIGTRRGALRALVATGPVITSAGIILAGTFAVLAMLPIDILLEIGTVVAFGVLVDTFVVRSMLVPAIISVVGDRSWWPSQLAKTAPAEAELEAPRRKEPV